MGHFEERIERHHGYSDDEICYCERNDEIPAKLIVEQVLFLEICSEMVSSAWNSSSLPSYAHSEASVLFISQFVLRSRSAWDEEEEEDVLIPHFRFNQTLSLYIIPSCIFVSLLVSTSLRPFLLLLSTNSFNLSSISFVKPNSSFSPAQSSPPFPIFVFLSWSIPRQQLRILHLFD